MPMRLFVLFLFAINRRRKNWMEKQVNSDERFSKHPSTSLSIVSINLLAFYHQRRSLIGYATHYLFCDR